MRDRTKFARNIILGIFCGFFVILCVCAVALACQIGWDANQPTQDQADSDGSFSYVLETTFEADTGTCHTVYFAPAVLEGDNVEDVSITPNRFDNICDDNGIGGTRWHLLETVNAGKLSDTSQNGLFRTEVYASPGYCAGEHRCTILHP